MDLMKKAQRWDEKVLDQLQSKKEKLTDELKQGIYCTMRVNYSCSSATLLFFYFFCWMEARRKMVFKFILQAYSKLGQGKAAVHFKPVWMQSADR